MKTPLAFTVLVAALSVAAFSNPATQEYSATVQAEIVLPSKSETGEKVDELSGLAYDADEQVLYAVSDDGILHHIAIAGLETNSPSAEVTYSVVLRANNLNLRNAEGLDVRGSHNGKKGDSELLVAFEDGSAFASFTSEGALVAELPVPKGLIAMESAENENDGVESVAFTETDGIFAAPELPLAGKRATQHIIYSNGLGSGTTSYAFARLSGETGRIKALDVDSGVRILVLERHRNDADQKFRNHLRMVHDCNGEVAKICAVSEFEFPPGALDDKPLEGMTLIGKNLVALISDMKMKDGVSVLVLARIGK